ncbi:MAG TPA: M20 family metallopeptidase [Terriglobales bacterium]|nr:M20 family metallopeptidase [Terriglobales bacterium]
MPPRKSNSPEGRPKLAKGKTRTLNRLALAGTDRGCGGGSEASSKLLRYVENRQGAMIETIRHLVELESPSHEKPALDRLGERLAQSFQKLGGKTQFHSGINSGNHLQVDFSGSSLHRHGEPLLLLGHFDTVWELGTLATMPFQIAEERLWGPGVYDMKTGIAQMIFAIEAIDACGYGVPRPITVLLVSDEEVGSESSRQITESVARKCGAVLVLEPSFGLQGALKTSRKGVGTYYLTVKGKAAHAGLDFEMGANAIVEMSRQLIAISEFTDAKRGVSLSPGIVQGGTRSNVIPAEASAEIDVRVTTMRDVPYLQRKFKSLKPFNPRCELQITGGVNRPPLERAKEVVSLLAKAQQIGRELGMDLGEAAVGGGSDGNFTAAIGIPTLDGLGAVGEGAHARHESVLIAALAPRTALLARLIQEI